MPNSIGMVTHCITQLMKWHPVAFHSKTLKCLKSPNKPEELWRNPSNALSFVFTSSIYTFYLFHKSLLSSLLHITFSLKVLLVSFLLPRKKSDLSLRKKISYTTSSGPITTFNGTTCSKCLGVCQHTWHCTHRIQIPQCEQAINNRPKLLFSLSSKTIRSFKFSCVDTTSV